MSTDGPYDPLSRPPSAPEEMLLHSQQQSQQHSGPHHQLHSTSKKSLKSSKPRGGLAWAIVRVTAMTTAALSLMIVTGAYLWLSNLGVFNTDLSQLDLITKNHAPDNSSIYARDGSKIGEIFSSYHVFVAFADLPKPLVDAVIATEDRNFWQHHGYDPRGMLRAALSYVHKGVVSQGASTLTQQVVRNFLLPTTRSLDRKVQEIALAIQLEKKLTKQEIFEIYANHMFLGNGAYGVGAAAFRYFGKSVQDLDQGECALIAGLFQSPSRYNPVRYPERAKKRQILVLKSMHQDKMLTGERTKELIRAKLVYKDYHPLNEDIAPYFIDYVKEEAAKILAKLNTGQDHLNSLGLHIHTTLDPKLQKLAELAIAAKAPLLKKASERAASYQAKDGTLHRPNLEAALLSVDPTTGEILSMVGGLNYAHSKFNRTVQALRSPGSAFKPVVYSQALSQGFKWSDVIFVSPVSVDTYRPRTPDEDFGQETTLLRAFYRSMNTPTIELGQKIGLKPVLERARMLGIRSPIKEEFGSMLGSSEVTMQDLARVYSSIANGGMLVEQMAITSIEDRSGQEIYKAAPVHSRESKALAPEIAFLMVQGMRDVLQMGTAVASAHLSQIAAGKTGTANESTDNWFCGFAPNLATVVWVGTDEHVQISGDTTGGKLALPIWDHYMTDAFRTRKPWSFKEPPGIVSAYVHPRFGNVSPAGVKMFFVKGSEPSSQPSALESISESPTASYRSLFQQ